MFLFPIIVVISLVLFIYYKVSILKTKDGLTQSYFNAKSKICLGSFVLFFGVNAYVVYQSRIALFIAIVFFIFGLMQIVRGFKESKHYRQEYQRIHES